MRRTMLLAAVLAVLLAGSPVWAQAPLTHLIQNASFEDPPFVRILPDEGLFTNNSVPRWTITTAGSASLGVVDLTGTAGSNNDTPPGAADGNNALWINRAVQATQQLPLMAVNGDTYTLRVAVKKRQTYTPNSYVIELLVDGVAKVSATTPAPGDTWQDAVVAYTAVPADAGKQIGIRIRVPVQDGTQTVFDNVRLETDGDAPAEGLLVNGSFNWPQLAGAAPGNCPGFPDGNNTLSSVFPGWNTTWQPWWGGGNLFIQRNNSVHGICSESDGAYFSLTGEGTFTERIWQVLGDPASPTLGNDTPLPSAEMSYTFSGLWKLGYGSGSGSMKAEIRTGNSPTGGAVIGTAQVAPGSGNQNTGLVPFTVSGTKPLGTTMLTVVLQLTVTGVTQMGWHADACTFGETVCFDPPSITTITSDGTAVDTDPVVVVRGTNPFNLTIIGENLGDAVADDTAVKLIKGATEITPIPGSVDVLPGATSLTCNFNMTGAALGAWNVSVDTGGNCVPAVESEAVTVILPAFVNPSFDDDNVGQCVADPTHPTDWSRFSETWKGEWLGTLNGYFDPPTNVLTPAELPTCPNDGPNFATIVENKSELFRKAYLYQTFPVNQGGKYTLSGQFAGSGQVLVEIALLNGLFDIGFTGFDTPENQIASTRVNESAGIYDWRTALVEGVAGDNYMTVVWRTKLMDVPGHNASHADGISVQECLPAQDITLIQVNPAQGFNNGVITNVVITGTQFDSGTPSVRLVGTSLKDVRVIPVSCVVDNATQMTCSIDLTGQASGRYNLVVQMGGCVETLLDGFTVIATDFINGAFEDPAAPVTLGNCSSAEIEPVPGIPTGWNSKDNMLRDSETPLPPNTGGSCDPRPSGGNDTHYGSLVAPSSATLKAWQYVKVNPGWKYRMKGDLWVHDGGAARFRLVDGIDENGIGTLVEVISAASTGNTWTYGEVETTAQSEVMTVIFEGDVPAGNAGFYADNLVFESTVSCNVPFADWDGDSDVDATDFAAFQRCFGETDPVSDECKCFDRPLGAGIGQADWNAFEACASGPGVDSTCD